MGQTVCVILSPSNRKRLEAIGLDRNRQRKHVERACVVLVSAESGPVQQVAALVGGQPADGLALAAALRRGRRGRAAS